MKKKWFKSPEVLVLRSKDGNGLELNHLATGKVCNLDSSPQNAFWSPWNGDCLSMKDFQALRDELLAGAFINTGYVPDITPDFRMDNQVPLIADEYIKWYKESPDLIILFNTKLMEKKNPLLVLAPYGSLCWEGITKGNTIGSIRREMANVFGYDEVIPFLKRLVHLGFIKPINGIEDGHFPVEKVTKEFFAPDIQFRLTHAALPWYCLWEINTICDLRCKTCYLPSLEDKGPNSHDALKIAQDLIESGIFYVSVMGGEALLRDDLPEIVKKLRSSGVFVKLITNGQCLTPSKAQVLAEAGINQIEVSFDGLCTEMHEFSRGPGTFSKALQAVENAKQAGIPRIGMVWTIHSSNIEELEELPVFMSGLGIRECYISLFKKAGKSGSAAPFDPPDPNMIYQINLCIEKWKKSFPDLIIALNSQCSCGRTSVVIGSNGDVRLCSFQYNSSGNIYRSSLLDIWRSIGKSLTDVSLPLGYCRRS